MRSPLSMLNQRHVVYFALRESDFLVKIGTTRGIHGRLKQLVTENGPMVLLGAARGDHKVERAIHRRFSKARVEGEWFALTDEQVSALLSRRLVCGRHIAFRHAPKRFARIAVIPDG